MPVVSRSGTTTTFDAENKLASLSGKNLPFSSLSDKLEDKKTNKKE